MGESCTLKGLYLSGKEGRIGAGLDLDTVDHGSG